MPTLKADAALYGAIEVARLAAVEIAEPGAVGEHLGVDMDAERLATHFFACVAPGYPGWRWAITLARPPRGRKPTVCETHLVPGEGSMVSPVWLPYAERLAPGDIGTGDRTPYVDEDPLLVAGFEATGDDDVDEVGFFELGLGRPRVLSAHGRAQAAQRWYEGDPGPSAEGARSAPAPCNSCGFFVPMAGVLRSLFGVCANAWSPSDASVVSIDHGCGAHSEVDLEARTSPVVEDPVLDDLAVDLVER